MSEIRVPRFVSVDGALYQRQADGSLKPHSGKSDWAKLSAMTHEDIEANASSDPDSLPFSDDEWKDVKVTRPRKVSITIRLDEDVLGYFQSKKGKYQTEINAALRKAMVNG